MHGRAGVVEVAPHGVLHELGQIARGLLNDIGREDIRLRVDIGDEVAALPGNRTDDGGFVDRDRPGGEVGALLRRPPAGVDVGLHAVTNFTPKGAKKGPLARLLRR